MRHTRHTITLSLLGILCGLALGACGGSAPAAVAPDRPAGLPVLPATGDPEAGRRLFAQGTLKIQPCSACHAVDDSGSAADMLGPSLKGIGSAAGTRVAGQDADTYLLNAMVNPNAHLVAGFAPDIMIAVEATPQQYKDVIAYLLTLK
jgi:mono/diheme cytochrome c family protein